MHDETPIYTGGCLCGAIRYECAESPVSAGTCHCRTCQRWAGGPYNAFVGFSTDALRFTKGKPKLYKKPIAIKEFGFCNECGSRVWDRYLVSLGENDPSGPQTVWIPIGTLDRPESVELKFHYGVETQLPWVHFHDDLPRMRCDEQEGLALAFERAKAGEI